jgi:hypothetical protein
VAERSEHIEQREFVQWVRQWTPLLIIAIPNGGKRGKLEGMRLQAEGVTAGVPDLQIPRFALWIEMKAKGGRLSPVQKAMHERLRSEGQTVEVCYSTAEAIDVVTQHMASRGMVPTRQPLRKMVER